jgi:hypothetical protein
MFLRSSNTSGFLAELDFSEMERDYPKVCFEEYVSCLKLARNGDLSGRMELLKQLSSALDIPCE